MRHQSSASLCMSCPRCREIDPTSAWTTSVSQNSLKPQSIALTSENQYNLQHVSPCLALDPYPVSCFNHPATGSQYPVGHDGHHNPRLAFGQVSTLLILSGGWRSQLGKTSRLESIGIQGSFISRGRGFELFCVFIPVILLEYNLVLTSPIRMIIF